MTPGGTPIRAAPLTVAGGTGHHSPNPCAEARADGSSVSGTVWAGVAAMIEARRSCAPLHGAGTTSTLGTGHPSVFGWRRDHPRFGTMLGLANVVDQATRVDPSVLTGLGERSVSDLLAPSDTDLAALGAYQVRWLTGDRTYRTEPAPR